MANARQNNLMNRNISSESPMGTGSIQSMAPQGFSNVSPSNLNNKATMPEGFVNFDRLLNQNAGTLKNKSNELNDVAGKVAGEVSGLASGIHGAGNNAMTDLGLSGLMTNALAASRGDATAKKALEDALNPQSTTENAPISETAGYTEGMNKLKNATLIPKQGSSNYGGGALDYALGDASYGNKIRDDIANSSSALEGAKSESVKRNQEIQAYNAKIKSYRDKMLGQGIETFNAAQGIANSPGQILETGDPFYKAQEVQKSTVGGMKELAKYLGIDPGKVEGANLAIPDFGSAAWSKSDNKWVPRESLTGGPTAEQVRGTHINEPDDSIPPAMRRKLMEIEDSIRNGSGNRGRGGYFSGEPAYQYQTYGYGDYDEPPGRYA